MEDLIRIKINSKFNYIFANAQILELSWLFDFYFVFLMFLIFPEPIFPFYPKPQKLQRILTINLLLFSLFELLCYLYETPCLTISLTFVLRSFSGSAPSFRTSSSQSSVEK